MPFFLLISHKENNCSYTYFLSTKCQFSKNTLLSFLFCVKKTYLKHTVLFFYKICHENPLLSYRYNDITFYVKNRPILAEKVLISRTFFWYQGLLLGSITGGIFFKKKKSWYQIKSLDIMPWITLFFFSQICNGLQGKKCVKTAKNRVLNFINLQNWKKAKLSCLL